MTGCLLSMSVLAMDEKAPAANSNQRPMDMNNPGSIADRLEEDEEPKEPLLELPDASTTKPWYDFKDELDEKYGLKFGISYTALYQEANNNFGPEDNAASYDFDFSGTWTFSGRETDTPTMLGFAAFARDTLGGHNLRPQTLFTQYGSLYSGAAPYGQENLAIGELWIQKKLSKNFGFRAGKIFPITAYDFFPFKNFRTDFIDFNHVTNNTIPLPGNGLGAFVQYRPQSNMMLRFGVHDANADVQKSGFDTYDGELFKIFEVGFDTGLLPRIPGGPPQGHVHVSLWHQDDREDAGIEDGWGIGVSAVQRFGRYTPFVRYGYADVDDIRGPTSTEHMVNAGVVIDDILGRSNDRIGVGYTWADPADRTLENQDAINAYYRIQLTREIQIGPTLEVIFDPVRNPTEDRVTVWGLRTRIAF